MSAVNKVVAALPVGPLRPNDIYFVRSGSGFDTVVIDAIGAPKWQNDEYVMHFGADFLLDPNEAVGWSIRGAFDDRQTVDLGNADAVTLSRLGGGIAFPFDVRVKRLWASHRNSNNSAQAWGWFLAKLDKTHGTNTQSTTFILHEPQENDNVGTRDYNNTDNQLTDIDLSGRVESVIPAGQVICLGVAAPTAANTNYYVQVMSGYLYLERVR